MIRTLLLSAGLALAACADPTPEMVEAAEPEVVMVDAAPTVDRAAIAAAVDAQPEDILARVQYRHPVETLEAIGIAPGMTVVDALPGSEGKGWYTGILARTLGANGADGKLIGVDYSIDMWPEFGGFADAEFIEGKRTWASDWVAGAEAREAAGEFGDADIDFEATTFGGANGEYAGQADAVLFMRALHNLARFEDRGGYLTEALAETYAMLKPGGVVGVVQHRGPEELSDDWADGSNGYLKQSFVVDAFEGAGFELVSASEVNANPLDIPTEDDVVWRLPPSLGTSRENPELKAEMEAIGESDRMTLVFRKPA